MAVLFLHFFSDLMELPLTVDEYLERVHKEHDRLFPTVPLMPGEYINQWRSLNVEKVKQIKGRLPDQVLNPFNCVPFQNWNFS